MICPKCGHETTGNFCSNCGAVLSADRFSDFKRESRRRSPERKENAIGNDQWLDDDFLFLDEEDGDGSRAVWKPESYREERTAPAQEQQREQAPKTFQEQISEVRQKPEEEKPSRKKEDVKKTVKTKEVKTKEDDKESRKEIRREEKREALKEKKEERREELRERRNAKFQEDADRESTRRGRGRRAMQRDEQEERNGRVRRYDTEKNSEYEAGNRAGYGAENRAGYRAGNRAKYGTGNRAGDGTGNGSDYGTEEYIIQESSGSSLGEMAAKGAVGMIVLSSRVMQLLSCFLMAVMVMTMTRSFLANAEGLGSIQMIVEDENYGLGLYLGFAGISLGMGVIWCLWILSRKPGGGEIRLKKFDTGRGFIPFLLCGAAVVLTGTALPFIPAQAEAWRGLAGGASAALTAVNSHYDFLLFCSVLGFILSLIRKVLRV